MSDKKWFRARNTFLGIPGRERLMSLTQFYDKIKNCNHPDAIWTRLILLELVRILDLCVILREFNDPRALCYLGLIENNDNILVKSALLKNPLAMAIYGRNITDYHMIKMAADLGEPLAHHELGHAFYHGWIDLKFNCVPLGGQRHIQLGITNFRIAAKLGLKESECRLSEMLDKHDPERYYWLFKVAKKRGELESRNEFKNAVIQHFIGGAFGNIAYQLGKSLNGATFNINVSIENRAIECFHEWNKRTRDAVDTWTIIAYRLKICKDIRKKIGMLIWESRVDGAYRLT